jgi:hypothetical protein
MNYGEMHMYQAPVISWQEQKPTQEQLAKLCADLRAEGQDELADMLGASP